MKGLLLLSLLSFLCTFAEENEDLGAHVIGIDLGTTYSCVGVFKNGRVDIIQNEQGNRITPSYVAFTSDGQRLIGDSAKNQLTSNPENTIYDVKRLIGRLYSDSSVQNDMKFWPFRVIDKNTRPHVVVNVKGEEKIFSAEEISSMVLSKMKETAETALEVELTHAVITVPAYFNDAQRQATKDAGAIAGLNVLRIINEPTAAAIAYGFDKKEELNVLVFDLGGGTFDVSVLSIDNGVFEVRSTNGDTHLGGEDFDNVVTQYVLSEIKKKHNINLSSNKRAIQRVRREVEKAKRTLSKRHKTEIELEDITGDGSVNFQTSLSRAKFEELCLKLFKSTLEPLRKVIEDSELEKNQINEVILVGGSTRIPKIQALVKEFFGGKEPNKGVNPDEAVAYGAAVQAAIMKGLKETQDLVLLDVNPLSLGIETQGGVMTVLIPRNSRIPTKKANIFSTVMDYQEGVDINVYEGERKLTKHNHLIRSFKLSEIEKASRGTPKIEVTFKFDQNGILHVSAEDKKTGKKENVQITDTDARPSPEDIEKMIKDAEFYAKEDETEKGRIQAKISLESDAYQIRSKLNEKEKLLEKISEEEIEQLKEASDDVISWLEKNAESLEEEYNLKKKEFSSKIDPILAKLGLDQAPPNEQAPFEQAEKSEEAEQEEL